MQGSYLLTKQARWAALVRNQRCNSDASIPCIKAIDNVKLNIGYPFGIGAGPTGHAPLILFTADERSAAPVVMFEGIPSSRPPSAVVAPAERHLFGSKM